jgi:hypothetical protein
MHSIATSQRLFLYLAVCILYQSQLKKKKNGAKSDSQSVLYLLDVYHFLNLLSVLTRPNGTQTVPIVKGPDHWSPYYAVRHDAASVNDGTYLERTYVSVPDQYRRHDMCRTERNP